MRPENFLNPAQQSKKFWLLRVLFRRGSCIHLGLMFAFSSGCLLQLLPVMMVLTLVLVNT